jgi:hypothetical protein
MLDNKLQLHFPMLIQQVGWVLLLFGVLTITGLLAFPNLILPVMGTIIGAIFTFSFQGAQLDLAGRKIREYFGLFGVKIGSWKDLPELQEIVFTSGRYSQQVHAWVSRTQQNTRIYRGFLKGPNSYKQLFSASENPDKVLSQVELAADAFGLPATNYNTKPPQRIR